MPLVAVNTLSFTTSSSKPDDGADDYDPDDEWKLQLRKRIEEGLQSLIEDAKENHPETRRRLEAGHQLTVQNIKKLAMEQCEIELDRERNQRRWIAGVPISPTWTWYFREEQPDIMNSFKQTNNQTDNSARIDRPSHHSPVSPDKWDSRSSGSKHSTERRLAHSPPGPPPEVWRSPISSAEDADTYNLARRGSVTSMRSTVSGTSMRSTGSFASSRPSIAETISEWADDDGPDESIIEENDYERGQESVERVRAWIAVDKPREKQKRPHLRKNSHQSPVDAGLRSDELFGSSGLGPASSSSTMQHATTVAPPPKGPLSAKPSLTKFVNDDHHHPNDTPGKPPPYYEHTSSPRDGYPHRDPSQDQPSSRRSSYVENDDPPYPTLHNPHRPRSPYHPHQESRPISRQPSFTHQPYLDHEDETDIDRGGRDRERFWDRDDEGGRDVYSEPRCTMTHPHPTPWHSPNPGPPPGSSRPAAPKDYFQDFHDDRSKVAAGPPNHGRHNYPNFPPDDWEYHRSPDGARPPPSRQPSYVRLRDDHDRRFSGNNDGYSRPPAGGSIPILRRTPSFDEVPTQPTWKEWGARGNNRHPNYDYHQEARSPPNGRFTQPPPSYHSGSPDDHPAFGGRETDSWRRGNDTVVDEYYSDEDTDLEGATEVERRDLKVKKQKHKKNRSEVDDEFKRSRLKMQEMARRQEEIQRFAEEVMKTKKEEEAKKMAEDAKRKEREVKEDAVRRKDDEARRKAEEFNRKVEETRRRAAQLEADAEETKRIQLEAQKIAENLKKMNEEVLRKDMEMKEREDILRWREEELKRQEELMHRQADNFRRKLEAKKEEAPKEAEGKTREELKEEVWKEEARKKEEAKQKQLDEEAKKRATEAKREEDIIKEKLKEEEAKRKADEAAKRREEDSKREEAKPGGLRREKEEKRRLDENHNLNDMFLDPDLKLMDPQLMDEQLLILQQAGYRKKVEHIRRNLEERKRNDSVGNDAGPSPHPPASPGTTPAMSKPPPQFTGPPIASAWRARPAPAWGPSIRPTAPPISTKPNASSSPTVNRSSASSASRRKPRTGPVRSGTHPMGSSPRTASFTEADRTRQQQEFAESQQEQFRRTQEKLEAERQLKSAGRPLSLSELRQVFEHHERLWNRLNTLGELSWNDFPWPMAKPPSNPDDMALPLISAYIQSPAYPDKDKSKTPKDRIKENIKKWHPDRFETKLLPKVVEDEREKVKLGAGNVARYLGDLLAKENESNN